MGIVAKQSAKNIVVIAIAFAIGAINTLVFYPIFLSADQYGLVVFLLASYLPFVDANNSFCFDQRGFEFL